MAYAPGVQDRSGELLAQGMGGMGQGIQQYMQNKQMAAQAIAEFEGAASQDPDLLKYLSHENANPDIKSAFNKLQKGGTVDFKNAAALANFSRSFAANKQKMQGEKDTKAIETALAAYSTSRDPAASLNAYMKAGGSGRGAEGLARVLSSFMSDPQNAVEPFTMPSAGPNGEPIKITIDKRTGRQLGSGPTVVPKTEINMGGNSYEKEVGSLAAQQHMKEYAAAVEAPVNIQKLDEVSAILKQGDPTTGIGAELINNINRIRSNFLADKKAGKSVSDTQVLDALLGSDVFPMIAALGVGARGLDTPAERDYLRQVMTGTLTLDKDALVRMAEIRRNIQVRALKKFEKSYEGGTYKKFFEVTGNPLPDFSFLETEEAPDGVDAIVWGEMKPEERALFKK